VDEGGWCVVGAGRLAAARRELQRGGRHRVGLYSIGAIVVEGGEGR
jgi:hypothetical protein